MKLLFLGIALSLLFAGCVEREAAYQSPSIPDFTRNQTHPLYEPVRIENQTIIENQTQQQFQNSSLRYNRTFYNETTGQNYTQYSNIPIVNETEEIEAFKAWANSHGVEVYGVNQSTDYFYYNNTTSSDFLPIENVPNVLQVANALYEIPDDLLAVMNGKALYLSHLRGRGYTILASSPDQHILAGVKKGIILEQPLGSEQVVHEFGHILDYHGIRGMYRDPQHRWNNLENERQRIFNVSFPYESNAASPPVGYIDVYSTANDAENFAQHFMYYVLHGNEFRQKAQNDALLREKYNFFKGRLFNGREYS